MSKLMAQQIMARRQLKTIGPVATVGEVLDVLNGNKHNGLPVLSNSGPLGSGR